MNALCSNSYPPKLKQKSQGYHEYDCINNEGQYSIFISFS